MKWRGMYTAMAGWMVMIAISSETVAQQRRPGGERPRLMRALDSDSDGRLSSSEIEKAASALRSLDADGDGRLSADEMDIPAGRRGASRPGSNSSTALQNAGLEAGMPLPDVTLLTSDGSPFALTQLRGHYSVLIFGCLT